MEQREIKFRAWTGSEMLYDVIPVNDSAVITDMQGTPPMANVLYRHDIQSIMQFTGEKDEVGTEIYEGDKVSHFDEYGDEHGGYKQEFIDEVTFNAGAFYPICMQPSTTFKVIGNIHEDSLHVK